MTAGCETNKQASANVVPLNVDFSWEGTSACGSRSPAFTVANVPPGTDVLSFRMVDLDVPGFSHGGGQVAYKGSPEIRAGEFSYTGPCPPSGSHRYEWTVRAIDEPSGAVLGEGAVMKRFPPR